MDADGYPTYGELNKLETWNFLEQPFEGFMEVLTASWNYGFERKDWKNGTIALYLATGGWSGNEDVIEALQGNFIFWSQCWERSAKGGAFWFKIPKSFQNLGKVD